MILFDLDDVLCDTTHRKHYIHRDYCQYVANAIALNDVDALLERHLSLHTSFSKDQDLWTPDYVAYDNACDGDGVIYSTIGSMKMFLHCNAPIQIWTARPESERMKTHAWLFSNGFEPNDFTIKMRPVGNTQPAWELKERWLDEQCKHVSLDLNTNITTRDSHGIDFVFDADPESIAMWRRRGIFCFDCRQL